MAASTAASKRCQVSLLFSPVDAGFLTMPRTYQTKQSSEVVVLPNALAIEVGFFITQCSLIEHYLCTTIFDMLKVGHKEGRYLLRAARLNEYITFIMTILKWREKPQPFNLIRYRKLCLNLKEFRDQLAHGIWLYSPEQGPMLRVTSGNWTSEQMDEEMATPHKIFTPEGRQISVEFLRRRNNLAQLATVWALLLKDHLAPSDSTPPKPSLSKVGARFVAMPAYPERRSQ
jgi:hypothetical protein